MCGVICVPIEKQGFFYSKILVKHFYMNCLDIALSVDVHL